MRHRAMGSAGSAARRVVVALVSVALVAAGGVALFQRNPSLAPDTKVAGHQADATYNWSIASFPQWAPPLTRAEMFLPWGPSLADWDAALETARSLSLERAAGQVIVASVSSPNARSAQELISDNHLGGVIVMGPAVTSASSVRQLTAAAHAAGADRDWPVIVSVDQEGGLVARLDGVVPGTPAFMAAGSSRDKGAVRLVYAHAGADMEDLGFTMNFAPVADVTVGLSDPVIRSRSAGSDPENVARTVIAAVEGYVDGGVVPVIKHFPGHGSVTTDSHFALPVQRASIDELRVRDFVPFEQAVDAGAPMIMMAHIQVGEWGSGPATLSPEAYSYLREELGFTGVIITDAFNMRAVTDTHGSAKAAVAALNAGADIVLMPADVSAAHAGIIAAVNDGRLPRARLDEAVARGIMLMRWQDSLKREAGLGEGDYAREFVGQATTVSAPLCGKRLVGSTVTIRGGWASERAELAAALAEHGIRTGGGTVIEIVGSPERGATADIVVALDGPWGLSRSDAKVYVGLYGRSPAALRGLADVLAGETSPQAVWPVPVSGMAYGPCPSPR